MIKRAIPFIALLLLFSLLCGCTPGATKNITGSAVRRARYISDSTVRREIS